MADENELNEQPNPPEEALKGRAPTGGKEYDEDSIRVLEGLEAVRKRPAMYIGDTDIAGLHHLVYEAVDNAIDEAMAGHCTNILVKINADGSCIVQDDGRGIPVGQMKHENPLLDGKPAVEIVMTVLHAGGKFDSDSYKVSAGLHGVGISVVNAVSEWLTVEVSRDGKIYAMRFERGETVKPLEIVGKSTKTGTRIEFKPDAQIFTETNFKYETLQNRLRELGFLNNGIRIQLVDESSGRQDEFHYANGLVEFVNYLDDGKEALTKNVITFSGADPDQQLECDIAMQYNDGYSENVLCFANNVHNMDGGTHLTGFRTALTRAMNNYAERAKLLKGTTRPTGDDLREGLTAVVAAKVGDPQFEAQTKVRLTNPEVQTFVEQTVYEKLSIFLEENPAEAKKIVLKGINAAQAREAARKARELARKSAMGGSSLPGKLWDCSSKNAEDTEIFLVEGDSAGGSAKMGRDNRYQAILPLKGKILNVEKARIDKMLGHEEIRTIITAMGCGIGADEFDIEKRRYDKIILMCDADVDGSHIRTLILTFLFRHMRPLIDAGHVYVAQPPLYLLSKGKKSDYLLNDQDLNARLTTRGVEGTTLIIRTGDGEEQEITGDQLRDILGTLDGIEIQARFLRRRGINFRELIESHRSETFGLPKLRVQILRSGQPAEERYLYSDEEFNELRRSEESVNSEVEVIEGGVIPVSAGDEENPRHIIVRHELAECRKLDQLLGDLESHGMSVADYFAIREELDTGELPPAKFTLRNGTEELIELDNVAEVGQGVRSLGAKGMQIKRFKGLGEMNPEELWETTMDREKRTLLRVQVSDDTDPEQVDIDAREADRIFSILMGENVEARRSFIESNAIHVKNLDI
jgi:DNA gyrase subunit B